MSAMARVAVIGGAGYVGLTLCAEMRLRGHEVTAVTRPNGRFLLERIGVRAESPDDLGRVGPIEAVVNLAYPNRGSIYEYPRRNRELLAIVRRFAAGGARVVHTSTQAVFGFGLEYPVVVRPVPTRRDYLYIESKIELERLLTHACGGGIAHRALGQCVGTGVSHLDRGAR